MEEVEVVISVEERIVVMKGVYVIDRRVSEIIRCRGSNSIEELVIGVICDLCAKFNVFGNHKAIYAWTLSGFVDN